MGFDSKGGFHSGHTQALDLGDLDKNVDRDDEWKVGGKGKTGWEERRRVSGWAAEEEGWGDFGDEGGGGGGGGGGHTAALDIEELREGGDLGGGGGRRSSRGGGGGGRSSDFDRPSGRGGGGGGWADDHDDDLEEDWGGKSGGRSGGGGGGRSGGGGGGGWDSGGNDDAWDNFGGGGGGGGHTAALDIQDFDSGPKARQQQNQRGRERGRHGELLDELENREEKIRYEDVRGESAGEDRKGKKSYSAGQGAKGASAERDASAERARDATERQRSRAEQDIRKMRVELDPDEPMMPLPGGPRHESTPGELAPHERTMALDVDAMRGAAAAPEPLPNRRPSPSMDLPRTQALEIEDLRRGAAAQPAELAPHERTHALDLSSLGVDAIPATQALRPVSGAKPADPLKTSTIDPSELESFRLNEASSGAQLLIFVEGTEPVAFELRPGVTNIGRDRSNHLVLADPHVSRKHLRIKKNSDNTFEIREQSSDNRILLNGQPCQDTLLHQSDEIQIGSTVMRFILGRPGSHDWSWPAKVHPPQSGHTASVRVPEELLMEPEPASSKASPRKPNKALIAVLVAFILGTLGLLTLAVAYVLWGDKLLGG